MFNEMVNDYYWEMINMDRESNEEYLSNNYKNIIEFTYGGRSGGWLGLVIDIDQGIRIEDINGGDYWLSNILFNFLWSSLKRCELIFGAIEIPSNFLWSSLKRGELIG